MTRLAPSDRVYHYDLPSVADEGASELSIQKSCRARVGREFPWCLVVAVPNGTNIASHHGRRKAKAEGLSKGFPDLMILAPGKTAYIEIKAKSALSSEQHDWLCTLHSYGFPCGVFRSQDTLAAKLIEWGFPRGERLVG